MLEDDRDVLVGRLALEKGMISAVQLRECLREQSTQTSTGKKRPLGVIMVSRGYLKDEQLVQLLDDQKRLLDESPSEVRRQDSLFGRLLIEQRVATPEQIDTALQMQADMDSEGLRPLPRLGQILAEMGVTDFDTISNTLKLQYKTLYDCPGCSMRYNLIGADPAKFYRCRKCTTVLRPTPPGSNAKADESAYGVRLEVMDHLPTEAAQAAMDEANHFDKYILIKEIGRGGMGTVYKAYQKDLKRMLALKILRGDDAEQTARFYQEAQTSAKLKHPNIVSLYEIGKCKGLTYLAMEYIEGQTLDRFRKLPLKKGVSLVKEVAFAVQHAHEKGIIHRDLKPQNILVDEKGRPYVSDFGLAREVSRDHRLTRSGIIVGTPSYMSPEQAQARPDLDAQCDVYALGAILYELITGTAPFLGQTQIDIVMNVLNRDPMPPSRLVPSCPPDLEAVCLMAMEKEKWRRYKSARDFGDDLQRFLEGEPVLAKRPTLVTKVFKKVKKHKAIAWVSIAAVLALAAGAVFLVLQLGRAKTREMLLEAKTLESERRYPEALSRYREVLKRDPGRGDAEAGIKRVRLALEALAEEARRKDIREKEEAARAQARARSEGFLQKARMSASDEEAVDWCSQAIAAVPEQEDAYLLRATLYQKLKKLDLAYADLGRAIPHSKNPLPLHLARAELAQALGRGEDALKELTRAVELNPLSADLRLKVGMARLTAADWARAEEDFSFVLLAQAENAEALAGRALARVMLEKTADALVDAAQAVRNSPNDAFPRAARAATFARSALKILGAEAPEVRELVRLILDAESDAESGRSSPHAAIGRTLLDKIETAIDDFEKSHPEAKLRRALSNDCAERAFQLVQNRDVDAAIRLGERALRFDRANPMAWSLRGFLRFNKGNFTGAQSDAERALELDPQCFEAMGVRGMARIGQALAAIQMTRLAGEDLSLGDGRREAPWLSHFVDGSVDIQRYFGHAADRPEFRQLKTLVPELDRQLAGLKADDGKTVITRYVSGKFVDRARRLAGADDDDCAIEILKRAVGLDDRNAAAYALRGELEFEGERWSDAIEDFKKAIELDPSLEKSLKPKMDEAKKKLDG